MIMCVYNVCVATVCVGHIHIPTHTPPDLNINPHPYHQPPRLLPPAEATTGGKKKDRGGRKAGGGFGGGFDGDGDSSSPYVQADLCINNACAVYNTAMIAAYVRVDPRLAGLVFLVKARFGFFFGGGRGGAFRGVCVCTTRMVRFC